MMRSLFRRRRPDSLGRTRSGRSPRSPLESLEARQLMATAPAAVTAAATVADAPRVAYVQFAPLTGRVLVTFAGDTSGLDPAQLTNPANYSLTPVKVSNKGPSVDPSRPNVGVVLVPRYKVTGVSLAPNIDPAQPQTVVVVVNNNQPIRPGTYRFTIRAAGIVDGAGLPLDGAYRGVFPSGNGRPGTNFAANLVLVRNTVQPALPVVPRPSGPSAPNGVRPRPVFYPSTTLTQVKIVGNNNEKSRMLGGGNAFVVALPGQDFPGTFRLPGTVGSAKAKASAHKGRG